MSVSLKNLWKGVLLFFALARRYCRAVVITDRPCSTDVTLWSFQWKDCTWQSVKHE